MNNLDDKYNSNNKNYPTATLPIADTDELIVFQGGVAKITDKSNVASSGSTITNITQIPNRSYNDLQGLPVLPTNSVVYSDTTGLIHTGTPVKTLIKSIPITAGTFINDGLYYIRIGIYTNQFVQTHLHMNNLPINPWPMGVNATGLAVMERHLFIKNNVLYSVDGQEIKEIQNQAGSHNAININITNTFDIYSQLYNGATANYLFFVINKLN